MTKVNHIKFTMYDGDTMDPSSTDLIIMEGRVEVGQPIPEGWTVHTGNQFDSQVTRIAYRYQIEEEGLAPND